MFFCIYYPGRILFRAQFHAHNFGKEVTNVMPFRGFQRVLRPLIGRQAAQLQFHGRPYSKTPTPPQDYYVCIAGLASLAAATYIVSVCKTVQMSR